MSAIPYMQGSDYAGEIVSGWTISEKFDGYFSRWTGERLLSREGIDFNAPEWFTVGLPPFPLDCELFAGCGQRGKLNNVHLCSAGQKRRWETFTLQVFDCPKVKGNYKERHETICAYEIHKRNRFVNVVTLNRQNLGTGFTPWLNAVVKNGGEGLMLRHPDAPYKIGRVRSMLKVKNLFQ